MFENKQVIKRQTSKKKNTKPWIAFYKKNSDIQ